MPSEKIQKTLAWLDDKGISYEVHYHPAIFTIEDCLAYWKDIEATHCKNLFMRNHKGNRHCSRLHRKQNCICKVDRKHL